LKLEKNTGKGRRWEWWRGS